MNLRPWKESAIMDAFRRDISKYPLLARDEEERLVKLAQAGDEDAKEHLVMSQARLVLVTSKRWAFRNVTEEDAVAAAMLGVVEAVNRYKLGTGARLSVYTMHYILMRLRRESWSMRRSVSMPMKPPSKVQHVAKFVREHIGEYGCPPEPEELVEKFAITRIRAQAIIAANVMDASLNVPLGHGPHATEWLDAVPADTPPPDTGADEYLTARRVQRLMSCLDDREKEIISRRFGLATGVEETLWEIGRDLGLSRERVRQLQDDALDKMIRGERRAALVKDAKRAMQGYRHVA